MESVFTTNIYNLVIKTFATKDYLLAVTQQEIEVLVKAFNTGEEKVMINGEEIFIKDPSMFKIYLINNNAYGTDASYIQKELRKYINATTNGHFESIIDVIEEFGINVTNKFINGKYGALKGSIVEEFDLAKPIISRAKKFAKDINRYDFSHITQFANKLDEQINMYDSGNRAIYLSHLCKGIIEEINNHKKTECNENPCRIEESLIEYLGYVTQELREVSPTNNSLNSEYFSSIEQIDLAIKFDTILEHLDKLHVGQQVVFEEIEELRNLTSTLNKKNWKEIVKGKLFDLGLNKAVENETIKFIYKSLTEESLNLLN